MVPHLAVSGSPTQVKVRLIFQSTEWTSLRKEAWRNKSGFGSPTLAAFLPFFRRILFGLRHLVDLLQTRGHPHVLCSGVRRFGLQKEI